VGDPLPIASQQAGDALDLIDHVINNLNERAAQKWLQLTLRAAGAFGRSEEDGARVTPREPVPDRPVPECKVISLCKDVVQDTQTGRFSLINIIDKFIARTFPGER
jgi:hypothetical protein